MDKEYPSYQLSMFVGGKGQQIVVRGETAAHLADLMEDFVEVPVDEVTGEEFGASPAQRVMDAVVATMGVAAVAGLKETFQAEKVSSTTSQAVSSGTGPSSAPSGGTGRCGVCGGPAEFRQGVAKSSGNPYKGYFCLTSRDHKPTFLK